jgi:hypothetical protein
MVNHITHLEDMVLEQGSIGAMKLQNMIWDIQNSQADISTKWDGAPSIFAGWDDDGFFVSTKSYLNKTGSVRYHSLAAIRDAGLDMQLFEKLGYCLYFLEDVVPRGMTLQGDLMFWPGSYEFVNGPYDGVTFQPNTIVYGIDNAHWKGWSLGVAWHSWISPRGDVSNPRFGNLLTTKQVLSIDPSMHQYSVDCDVLPEIAEALESIDSVWLDAVASHKELPALLKRSYNARLKGTFVDGTDEKFVMQTKLSQIASLRSDAGKRRHTDILDGMLNLMKGPNFSNLIKFQEVVRVAKKKIINSLELHSKVNTWVRTDDGLVPTAHEGYVIIGQSESIKLVDREQFSRFNFSTDIYKGWNAPTRT